MITGYFLAKKICMINLDTCGKQNKSNVLKESIRNLIHRYSSIFPYLLIATPIGIIIKGFAVGWSIPQIAIQFVRAIGDLLLLQNFGIAVPSRTGVIWYLSTMFISLWLLYPLLRLYYNKVIYCAPIIVAFGTGLIIMLHGSLEVPNEVFFGWFNAGILRSICAILLGCLIFTISNKFTKLNVSNGVPVMLGICEIGFYIVAILYMFFWQKKYGQLDWMAVLAMALGLIITTSRKSALADKFNNQSILFLGDFSKAVFLSHFQFINHYEEIFDKVGFTAGRIESRIIAITIVAVISTFVYLCGRKLKTVTDKFASRLTCILLPVTDET